MSSPEPNEEKLQRFASALRAAEEKQRIFVPPTVDEAILKEARRHFGGGKPAGEFRLWTWLALAGVTALVALLIFVLPRTKSPALAREDINADGQVDVLDAFALARAVEMTAPAPKLDQNADGKVDEADVRAVALTAVRIDRKS